MTRGREFSVKKDQDGVCSKFRVSRQAESACALVDHTVTSHNEWDYGDSLGDVTIRKPLKHRTVMEATFLLLQHLGSLKLQDRPLFPLLYRLSTDTF